MSEFQEKQHAATDKKIRDLRAKGDVPRSRDLMATAIILTSLTALVLYGDTFVSQMLNNFEFVASNMSSISNDDNALSVCVQTLFIKNIMLFLPLFVAILLAALIVPFLFGGWNFTFENMRFKFSKLSPLKNLKNIFTKLIYIEVLKSLLKITLILSILWIFFKIHMMTIVNLFHHDLLGGIKEANHLVIILFCQLGVAFILFSVIDVTWQQWQFSNKSKMSSQELKDEHKESEGSPDIKRRIKQAQDKILRQRLLISVPKANVIITNPNHYAVAIQYDENKNNAPFVLAKGKDLIADQIRQIAKKHAITIYSAPPLARALYFHVDINQEIPAELYMALAMVLSYVYQLKRYQIGSGQLPELSEIPIPDTFIHE
jgi:flagellar biosynthetic protein FlhB